MNSAVLSIFPETNTGIFEGYVGIRLWDGQLVDDVIFTLLLLLIISFAIVFRSRFRLFIKMMNDLIFVKERQSLFQGTSSNDWFFRNFMTFQSLVLSGIGLFAIARIYGYTDNMTETAILFSVGLIFLVLFLFYQFKQGLYFLIGCVFASSEKYRLWKISYNAIIGTWGMLLYIPVLWLVFVGNYSVIPILLFVFFYILCRIVIIYKTIRIFHTKNTAILYISLYLCAQEILPLLFIYKGLIYLYNIMETSTLWH